MVVFQGKLYAMDRPRDFDNNFLEQLGPIRFENAHFPASKAHNRAQDVLWCRNIETSVIYALKLMQNKHIIFL